MSKDRFVLLSFGIAIAAVLVAFGLRLLLEPIIGNSPSFFLSLGVVVIFQGGFIVWLTRTLGRAGRQTDVLKRLEEGVPAPGSAKAATRGQGDFLAVLSHELRNPLAPIRNALQVLQSSEFCDPELAEARNVIDRQIRQLAAIVDDLLDVYGITHQTITLRKEPFNLSDIVKLAVEDHRSALENSSLTLTLELPNEPIWVLADRIRLTQVVTNLLHNAAKFTNPHDRVTVRVVQDALTQRATVAVQDTGIGIAPELVPHVFDVFTQAEQSIDRRRGGLGLGMGLVKGLVELHGGAAQASSPGLGRGSQVSFWLPLGKKPRETQKAPLPVIQSARRLRILIVEDNRDTARTLQVLLARYGHEVALSYSGTEGVQTAQAWHPEVVLCDIGLPEMDGYEVASALRHNPDTAWTRLIAVSGYDREDDHRRSEEAGFDLHLTKPVDPVELQRLLSVLRVGP